MRRRTGKPWLARVKWSGVPLDTLTTRFLVLFVLVLLIPGLSLVGFSASQLASQLKQQLQSSREQAITQVKTQLTRAKVQLKALASLDKLVNLPYPWLNLSPTELTLENHPKPGRVMVNYKPLNNKKANQPLLVTPKLSADKTTSLLGIPLEQVFPLQSLYESTGLQAVWIPASSTGSEKSVDLYPMATYPQPISPAVQVSMQKAITQWQEGSKPQQTDTNGQDWAIWHWPWLNDDDQWLGSIVFAFPTKAIQNQWMGFYAGVYVLFLISFLFACSMAIWASRTMTVPLRALVLQLNDLSQSVTEWAGQSKPLPQLQEKNPIFELR